jgi:quinol monooxygenase YgiN
VPLFVSVHQHVPAERLSQVLATIRQDFATSRRVHPGRRATRIFQHLHLPQILALGEWASAADYERLYQSPGYRATSVESDPPARIEYLDRLTFTARMHIRSHIAAAAIVTAPGATCDDVVAMLATAVRRDMLAEAGLATHELYRAREDRCRLLVLHTWESVEALERYRAVKSGQHEVGLAGLGARMERFVGSVAAEFSHVMEPERPGSAR